MKPAGVDQFALEKQADKARNISMAFFLLTDCFPGHHLKGLLRGRVHVTFCRMGTAEEFHSKGLKGFPKVHVLETSSSRQHSWEEGLCPHS